MEIKLRLLVAPQTRGAGTCEPLDVLHVDIDGDIPSRIDEIKKLAREECAKRKLTLRTVSVDANSTRDVLVYVRHDDNANAALLQRKPAVTRSGPHGGPLGREVKRISQRAVRRRNRGPR